MTLHHTLYSGRPLLPEQPSYICIEPRVHLALSLGAPNNTHNQRNKQNHAHNNSSGEEACRVIDEYDNIYQPVQADTDESPEEVEDGKLTFDEIYSKYTSSPQTTSTVWKAEDFFKFMKEVEDNA